MGVSLYNAYPFILSASSLFLTGSKKNHVSQANKLKREERLNEIDDLLQNNKGLQEQIMQKLDEARALNASTEVGNSSVLYNSTLFLFVYYL